MIALPMRLQLLASRVDDELRQEVDKLTTAADASVQRLRNLVFRLQPPELDNEGLSNALESYLQQVTESIELDWRLQCDLPAEPATDVAVTIFRIIQEALANVQRHARASIVEVMLRTLGQGIHAQCETTASGPTSPRTGTEVVAVGRDTAQAIEMVEQHRPDVAVLDVRMPGGGGAVAAREIARRTPQVRLVALSAYSDSGTRAAMTAAGAHAHLVKGEPNAQIVSTVRLLCARDDTPQQ